MDAKSSSRDGLDATAQAELVRRGEVSPLELVEAAIRRIEEINPRVNAVVTATFERACQAARSGALPRGPFHGVPFLLKDLGAHSVGDPFHAGMRLLREMSWKAPYDTYLATRFRNAGFVFLGKTNTPELGLLPTTEPLSYGPTRNPWDVAYSPGGSSGGAAAAVAAGLVPAAHATDGGGSIRIPASHCGLVGLKPSRGRVSLGPDAGERWGGLAVENSVTRTVRDAAAILDVAAGSMPGDPYCAPLPVRPFVAEVGTAPGRLRIGLLLRAPGGMPVHGDCVEAAERAARLLESLGHDVELSQPDGLEDPQFTVAVGGIIACSVARALVVWGEKLGRHVVAADVEPGTWAVAELGRSAGVTDYLRMRDLVEQKTRRMATWWAGGFDLLLTPTCAEPPPLLGSFAVTAEEPLAGFYRAAAFGTFTGPFNASGQPAISLPLHWNAHGLPVGVQLVAAYGREDVLLRVAAQVEAAQPWAQRRPPLCV